MLQNNTSLSPDIVAEELPDHFFPLQIVEYMRSTYPKEDLGHFENVALLHQYTNGVKYWIFLTTLDGLAQ